MRTSLLILLFTFLVTPHAFAERPRRTRERKSAGNFEANRLLKKAKELLMLKEYERGMKMLQTIINNYPASIVKFKAWLELGKHYLETHKEEEAIRAFAQLKKLKTADKELKGQKLELYLEALYLTGVTYYRTRLYNSAFPVLRQITRNFPNTIWANQAYYYIGMCHFMQENWNKAIEALSLVGTFVDPTDENIRYVEAGQRFYMKLLDDDFPILNHLGRKITAKVETQSGDRETVRCQALSSKGKTYLGSLATEIGTANDKNKQDGILQVLGGDVITATYVDDNTLDGTHNVLRQNVTRIVSSASMDFTLGTFEGRAVAAFIGQPLFLLLKDADLDKSDNAETISVKVISRYKIEKEDGDSSAADLQSIDIEQLFSGKEEKDEYVIHDEVMVELKELGKPPVRSGKLGGRAKLKKSSRSEAADRTDDILECAVEDEIVAFYTDHLHIAGDFARDVLAVTIVAGEIDGRPRATQNVVFNAIIKARKNLVEGRAYRELGRIFSDMGLIDGAKERCEEGIVKVDEITRIQLPIPRDLKEKAYQLKWELQMVMQDYGGAIQTCQIFNRLYPESPLVDRALKEIGMIHVAKENFQQAIEIFQQILKLTASEIKAEAAFRIAETVEKMKDLSASIPAYKKCSTQYPDSEFAGPALAKEIDYYYSTKDFIQANELLEQVFQDYPDAPFLDNMLIKWVLVAYRVGDYVKAQEKAKQLLFEYPSSPYASKIKRILPKIEKKLEKRKKKEGEKE